MLAMKEALTIPKTPELSPAEDYNLLLKQALGNVEKLGSDLWTDYNVHDPGIMMLENLVFAATEMAYKTGMPIADHLAEELQKGGQNQAFFTAAQTLTINPVTLNDFRKLLIDANGVHNAWLVIRDCSCEMPLYADCEEDALVFTPQDTNEIIPKGMYNVLLEPEADPLYGELSNGKLFTAYQFNSNTSVCELELRFPTVSKLEWQTDFFEKFIDTSKTINSIGIHLFNKDNVPLTSSNELQKALKYPLRSVWKIDIDSELTVWSQVPLIIHLRKAADTEKIKFNQLVNYLTQTANGPLTYLREKAVRLLEIRQNSRALLNSHRNLDDDFCQITEIGTEDIAVCADIQLAPYADIEHIQALVWFEIEQYFNPTLRFYSLKELQEEGVPTEEIFNGPFLKHGFVKEEELIATDLKTSIHATDIINRLMDLEGVLAVRNFVFTKYDAAGFPLQPSQPWSMSIASQNRASLYIQRSKLLFFKNELPFLPANADEVLANLQQLRGDTAAMKLRVTENDLPMPKGTLMEHEPWYPVQFQLPLTYGVSPHGLPVNATQNRRAIAKQLKAYMMLLEQPLANGIAQTEAFPALFSLDENQLHSYFGQLVSGNELAMSDVDPVKNELYNNPAFTDNELQMLLETPEEGISRRSKFLDHQLARFGESFQEYALLFAEIESNTSGSFNASKKTELALLKQKIRFLKHNSRFGTQHFKAFDHHDPLLVTGLHNIPGIKYRLAHLLGLGMLRNFIQINYFFQDNIWQAEITLLNENGQIWFKNASPITANVRHELVEKVNRWTDELYVFIVDDTAYASILNGGTWAFHIAGDIIADLAVSDATFASQALADQAADELLDWARLQLKPERFFVVEHLLLRPTHYGMLPLEVCLGTDCAPCDEADPYSFRFTYVMPGWINLFDRVEYRRYAERVIREETPSHLLPKICWLGNEIYPGRGDEAILCILMGLTSTVMAQPLSEDDRKKACACATQILDLFNEQYAEAVYNKGFQTLTDLEKEALFDNELLPVLPCLGALPVNVQNQIKQELVNYFNENTCKELVTDDEEVAADKALCFQMNHFHKLWNEFLKEQAALPQDKPAVEELILEVLTQSFMGRLLGEFSAATIPGMKQDLQRILTFFGGQLDTATQANIMAWIANDSGVPLSRSLLLQLHEVVRESLCGFIQQVMEFMGDKIKLYLFDIAKYGKPTPQNAIWLTKLEALLNEVKNEHPSALIIDAAVFASLLDSIKTEYQQIRKLLCVHARLVYLFSRLKSVYPAATLHDCEDGDDDNPVSLDNSIIV